MDPSLGLIRRKADRCQVIVYRYGPWWGVCIAVCTQQYFNTVSDSSESLVNRFPESVSVKQSTSSLRHIVSTVFTWVTSFFFQIVFTRRYVAEAEKGEIFFALNNSWVIMHSQPDDHPAWLFPLKFARIKTTVCHIGKWRTFNASLWQLYISLLVKEFCSSLNMHSSFKLPERLLDILSLKRKKMPINFLSAGIPVVCEVKANDDSHQFEKHNLTMLLVTSIHREPSHRKESTSERSGFAFTHCTSCDVWGILHFPWPRPLVGKQKQGKVEWTERTVLLSLS